MLHAPAVPPGSNPPKKMCFPRCPQGLGTPNVSLLAASGHGLPGPGLAAVAAAGSLLSDLADQVGKSGCHPSPGRADPPGVNPHAPLPHSTPRGNFLAMMYVLRTRKLRPESHRREAFSYIHKCRPPLPSFLSLLLLSPLSPTKVSSFSA